MTPLACTPCYLSYYILLYLVSILKHNCKVQLAFSIDKRDCILDSSAIVHRKFSYHCCCTTENLLLYPGSGYIYLRRIFIYVNSFVFCNLKLLKWHFELWLDLIVSVVWNTSQNHELLNLIFKSNLYLWAHFEIKNQKWDKRHDMTKTTYMKIMVKFFYHWSTENLILYPGSSYDYLWRISIYVNDFFCKVKLLKWQVELGMYKMPVEPF